MEQEHREPEGAAEGGGDTSVPRDPWAGWAGAGSGQGKGRQGLGWGELSPGEFVTEGLEMGLIPPAPTLGDPPSSGRAPARGVPGWFGAGAALTAAAGGQERGQQQQQDERQPHGGAGQGDTGWHSPAG